MNHIIIAAFSCFVVTTPIVAGELTYRFVDADKDADRTVYVPRIARTKPVTIDGKLDDAFWKTSPRLTEFVDQIGKQGKTTLQLGYDAGYIYLGVVCEMTDPKAIVSRAPSGARDQKVWGGHCIDFKIGVPGKAWQFLVAPSGALMDMQDGNTEWNASCEVKAKIVDNGYVVEMRIKYGTFHLPNNADGWPLKIAFGRATPDEQIQTLSRPYGSLEKAPTFILGTDKDAARVQSGRFISRKTTLVWSTDREEYSTATPSATGRVRIIDLGGERLKGEAAVQFAVTDGTQDLIAERVYPVEGRNFNYDVKLSSLKPGEYTAELRLMDGDEVFDRVKRRLVVEPADVPRSGQIALTVPACPAALPAWPITFGVPFPEGALASKDQLNLTDSTGREIPIQTKVTSRWSRGGTIRWVLIDAVVPVKTTEQRFTLAYADVGRGDPFDKAITVTETAMPEGQPALRIESDRIKAWIPNWTAPHRGNGVL